MSEFHRLIVSRRGAEARRTEDRDQKTEVGSQRAQMKRGLKSNTLCNTIGCVPKVREKTSEKMKKAVQEDGRSRSGALRRRVERIGNYGEV